MTPLNNEQKQGIIERINFLKVELADLESKYINISWQEYKDDRDKRRNVERIVENLANACIDIAKIVLSGETIEIPGTYQEIILKLGENKIVDISLAEKVAKLARMRNVLAHQYLDLKWELIKPLIAEAPDFITKFIDQLKV